MKKNMSVILLLISCLLLLFGFISIQRAIHEKKILRQIIARFQADSRIAEVLVTNVHFDEKSNKTFTTIKFLEYDAQGKPLQPRYFTFPGNIIQFQSLVIRFDDFLIASSHPLKGKSAYLFWKVFMLDGNNTKEYELTALNAVPEGYRVSSASRKVEERLWRKFWSYALNTAIAKKQGIKNAQIEAPGTTFIPGVLYTIRLEHDGGMRIDVQELPSIVRGEYIPSGVENKEKRVERNM